MHIGSLCVRLLLRQARTLKDKRQVVRSITDRLKQGFNVAVSEVEAQDQCQQIVLGIVSVADEAQAVKGTLEAVANALRGHPIAEFASCTMNVDRWEQD